MHLPAMVDLVQEQMREQISDALGDLAGLAAIGKDLPVQIGLAETVAASQLCPANRMGRLPDEE